MLVLEIPSLFDIQTVARSHFRKRQPTIDYPHTLLLALPFTFKSPYSFRFRCGDRLIYRAAYCMLVLGDATVIGRRVETAPQPLRMRSRLPFSLPWRLSSGNGVIVSWPCRRLLTICWVVWLDVQGRARRRAKRALWGREFTRGVRWRSFLGTYVVRRRQLVLLWRCNREADAHQVGSDPQVQPFPFLESRPLLPLGRARSRKALGGVNSCRQCPCPSPSPQAPRPRLRQALLLQRAGRVWAARAQLHRRVPAGVLRRSGCGEGDGRASCEIPPR